MNIGLFTDTFFPQLNGVATSVHTLADALEKRGHTVYIFTPSDPRVSPQENPHILRMPSMPFVLLRNYRVGVVYSPMMLNRIAHLRLDIIHTQTEFSLGMFGKFLSFVQRTPMVHTYHTMYEDYVHYIAGGHLLSPDFAKKFSRLFCNIAKAVVAPTEKTRGLLESYGVTKPIHIIPTGIDTSLFAKENFTTEDTKALKRSLGLEEDAPVILSLGRIAKEKSIDVILRAMPALFSSLPKARLVVVGDGPELPVLRQQAEALGIADKTIFTGPKPWSEIGRYYQLGTVFVSASVSETQGLTFAEAMAGGIPVVAKRDPCIEALVKHEETGLLFDTEEELTACLQRVLDDAALRDRFSAASAAQMQDLSVERFAERIEHVYTTICEEHAQREHLLERVRHLPTRIFVRKRSTSAHDENHHNQHMM